MPDPGSSFPFPRIEALPHLTRVGPLGAWKRTWRARHTVATVALTPLALLLLRSALPTDTTLGPLWWSLLALAALVAAMTWATYLPVPPTADSIVPSSPCAATGGAFPLLAAMALSVGPASVASPIAALVLTAMGLSQRVIGTVLCGTPPPPTARGPLA